MEDSLQNITTKLTDSQIIKVFDYCKKKSNQQISDKYRALSENTKQEIFNLEYCKCLEKQYTKCLKQLYKSEHGGVGGCQSIVDEYSVQGKD